MSVTIRVFVDRARLPSVKEWNDAIRAQAFALKIDAFDLRADSAFRPCEHEGHASGFEYYLGPRDADDGADATRVGTRDGVVDFVTHADMREGLCSVIAAGVLCAIADGVLWDTEANEWVSAPDALRWAREVESEFRKSL